MAKFCTKCGKPLEEGAVCPCREQAAQAITNQQPGSGENIPYQQPGPVSYQQQAKQPKVKGGSYRNRVFSMLFGLLKSPVTAAKKAAATGDYAAAIGLIIMQAILSGICSTQFICALLKGMPVESIIVSALKAFFLTTMISLVFSLILAGMLYLFVKLFRGSTAPKLMLTAAAARSAAIIPVSAVAILIFFLNPIYAAVLFYTGSLLGICFLTSTLKAAAIISSDKIPYIIFLASLFLLILFYFTVKAVLPVYLPEQFKNIFNYYNLSNLQSNYR